MTLFVIFFFLCSVSAQRFTYSYTYRSTLPETRDRRNGFVSYTDTTLAGLVSELNGFITINNWRHIELYLARPSRVGNEVCWEFERRKRDSTAGKGPAKQDINAETGDLDAREASLPDVESYREDGLQQRPDPTNRFDPLSTCQSPILTTERPVRRPFWQTTFTPMAAFWKDGSASSSARNSLAVCPVP